jgi:hypothetical protein
MQKTRRRGVVPAIALGCAIAASTGQTAQKAPTPKPPAVEDWTAVGKLPDFTGVWELSFGGGGGRGAAGRGAAGPGAARGALPQGPQLTATAAAKRKELQSQPREDNQTANCLPPGMPGIMGQPYPMEFLLTPGLVTIVIEAYTQVRHIYTDGRALPADPDQKFHGTSVGHWEGDTLVAETVGFSPLTEIAANLPHGDTMRIVERFRLTDPNTMTIETTVTDPDVLTAPYTTARTLRRHRTWTIAEYICEENNRNFVDQNGKAGVNLNHAEPAKKEQ